MVRYTELYHIEGNDTISAIYIPNSFTPDGDGINDLFKCYLDGYWFNPEFEISIYDSHGVIVFQSTNPNHYWDGTFYSTRIQSDFYDYRIKAKDYLDYQFDFTGKIQMLQ